MRKNLLFYIISTLLLAFLLLFYINNNKELNGYIRNDEHYQSTLNHFQDLSRQVNNAAVLNPELEKVMGSLRIGSLFVADKKMIMLELDQLKRSTIDSLNIITASTLETLILREIDWLLENSLPDIIIRHPSDEHIASFQEINALIDNGIERANFLIRRNNELLNDKVKKIRGYLISFLFLSGVMLLYSLSIVFYTRKKK